MLGVSGVIVVVYVGWVVGDLVVMCLFVVLPVGWFVVLPLTVVVCLPSALVCGFIVVCAAWFFCFGWILLVVVVLLFVKFA